MASLPSAAYPSQAARYDRDTLRAAGGVAVTALAAQGLLFLPVPLVLRAVAALTLLWLPGIPAAALALRGVVATWAERAALAVGLGVAGMVVGGLALAYLPAPLDRPLVLLGVDLLLMVLLGVWALQTPSVSPPPGERQATIGKVAAPALEDETLRVTQGARHAPLFAVEPGTVDIKGPYSNPLARGQGTGAATLGHALLVAALLLGAALRLTHLGYAEFQGDEARAMLMAEGLAQGRDDVLFVHKKAPAEVVLPALIGAAAGGIDEAAARLPFAMANLAAVLAVGALGWRLFGPQSLRVDPQEPAPSASILPPQAGGPRGVGVGPLVGGLAALALALDGYFQGFGRIVQYQSVVALMSILGAWAAWRYYEDGRARWPVLGAGLVAVGTLGHYEAVFALVPLAYLVGRRVQADPTPPLSASGEGASGVAPRAGRWRGGRAILAPSVAFAAVAGFFYLPFALHPHFGATVRYILDRRVGGGGEGGGPLYNNLTDYFTRATFYNATWWIGFMVVALVVVLGWLGWRAFGPSVAGSFRVRPQEPAPSLHSELVLSLPKEQALSKANGSASKSLSGFAAAAWPALAVLLAGLVPDSLRVGPVSLAILLFLPLGLWLLAPRLGDGVKAVLAWFLAPLLVAAFLVQKPHTHFYTMMPGWALLVAFGLAALWTGARAAWLRWAVALIALVVALLQIGYLWIVFVDHQPEYKRIYPAARSPLYPVIYGDTPPRGGYFGFPYRAGWGVVASLFAAGTLQGDYDSNEEPLITGWYTRGATRCPGSPRYTIVAQHVQDEEKIPLGRVERDYHLLGVVEVDGAAKLQIYSRDPVPSVRRFTLADSVRLNPTTGPPFPIGQALAEAVPAVTTDASFGPLRLLGYELDRSVVKPGETVDLTLFWQATEPPSADLTVFSHIADDRIRGQSDGWPVCGTRPTSGWQPGETIIDSRSLRLDPATPPGEYPVRVGLYDAATGQRTPATGGDAAGDQAILGMLVVKP